MLDREQLLPQPSGIDRWTLGDRELCAALAFSQLPQVSSRRSRNSGEDKPPACVGALLDLPAGLLYRIVFNFPDFRLRPS